MVKRQGSSQKRLTPGAKAPELAAGLSPSMSMKPGITIIPAASMMFSWPGEYSGRSTDWMRVPSMVIDPQAISVVTSMRRASHNVNGIDPYHLPCVNYFVAVS